MKLERLLKFYLLMICFPALAHAQAWSGIISSGRAINWSNAGVNGGIPNRTTICTTIAPYGTSGAPASPSTINSAIQSCPAGQVVSLGAGSFYLSAGITFANKSNVTLRGAGPDKTFIYFFGADGCTGDFGDVCFQDDLGYYQHSTPVQPGGSNAATWSGGYSQGTTQITLTNVGGSGISVGQYIILDQANDNSDNGGFLVCDNQNTPCSLEGGSPGRTINGIDYNQQQIVKVTAINGSTYTISPGLYAPNWSSSKNPGAWWAHSIQNSGIENISLDHTNSSNATSGTVFVNAFNCWLRNVRSINGNRNHSWLLQSAHITIRDSYFYGTKNAGVTSYGVEAFQTSDDLIENNICEHVTACMMMGPSVGSVYGYNFGIDGYVVGTNVMSPMIWGTHDAGVMYNLYEGNIGNGFNTDLFHGTGNTGTIFRNYFTGYESGKQGNIFAFNMNALSRNFNFVGNVLGTLGVHTVYENYPGCSSGCLGVPIYQFGFGNGPDLGVTVPSDTLTRPTMLRWGNYDTVTGSAVFNSAEIPTTLSGSMVNAVVSTQILPASFYLAGRPPFFVTPSGTPAFPPIGPDVTGGTATAPDLTGNHTAPGGHAYAIPAEICYYKSNMDSNYSGAADRGVLVFNANNCYSSSGSIPAPPTNLKTAIQ